MAKAYNVMAENHRHSNGPWKLMTNYAIAASTRVSGNPTILDIATGPGEPAISVAKRLPNATVIASDLSEDMIKIASKAGEGVDNFKTVVCNAEDLSQFESNSIDIVTCCYGYMFPTDKPAAMSESYRVLKSGGTLIATTWDVLDFMAVIKDTMTEVLGFTPPPPPLNPMSLSEEGLFYNLVRDAGFGSIQQTTSTYPFNLGSDKDFQFTVGTLLVREKLNQMTADGDEKAWDRADKAFWANIGKYSEEVNGEMLIPRNTFRLTTAKKL